MLVPRFLTPVPLDELVTALDAGHHERFGYGLSRESYAVAAAQLELEHGTGEIGGKLCLRGVWNDNLGNHDAPASVRADPAIPIFATVPEREIASGGTERRAQHVREAYPDAVEGARGYWSALYESFGSAYDRIVDGDPEGFVEALKAARYFTGPLGAYESFVESRVAAWTARMAAADGA